MTVGSVNMWTLLTSVHIELTSHQSTVSTVTSCLHVPRYVGPDFFTLLLAETFLHSLSSCLSSSILLTHALQLPLFNCQSVTCCPLYCAHSDLQYTVQQRVNGTANIRRHKHAINVLIICRINSSALPANPYDMGFFVDLFVY